MNIDKELLDSMMVEVKKSLILNDNKDYIAIINKKMEDNLVAIYDAITEIKLKDSETFKTVKKLVAKQECYKILRQQYLDNNVKSTGIRL